MIYYGRMVSSSLSILGDKQIYSRRNEAFGKIHKFLSCENEQCKNVTVLGFVTRAPLNLVPRLPIYSNHNGNYNRWQLMLTGHNIEMSVNGASTICGCVSTVIEQLFGCCDA